MSESTDDNDEIYGLVDDEDEGEDDEIYGFVDDEDEDAEQQPEDTK